MIRPAPPLLPLGEDLGGRTLTGFDSAVRR